MDERAGNRAALHLAARELRRVVREPVGQRRRARRAPARAGAAAAARCARRAAAAARRSRASVSVGSRLKNWKTKPTRSRRIAGQLVVAKRRQGTPTRGARRRTTADPSRRTGAAASTCRSRTVRRGRRSRPARPQGSRRRPHGPRCRRSYTCGGRCQRRERGSRVPGCQSAKGARGARVRCQGARGAFVASAFRRKWLVPECIEFARAPCTLAPWHPGTLAPCYAFFLRICTSRPPSANCTSSMRPLMRKIPRPLGLRMFSGWSGSATAV